MGGWFHNLMARIRSTPAWVWISIALAAGVLVVTWLIYRQKQNAADSGGAVPGNGTGQPNWPGGDSNSLDAQELQQLLAELQDLIDKLPKPAPPGGDKKPPPGGKKPPKTKTITLSKPESFNQIAVEQGLGLKNVDWLKSWNLNLKNLPGWGKPWWTLPAGTKVVIPIPGS